MYINYYIFSQVCKTSSGQQVNPIIGLIIFVLIFLAFSLSYRILRDRKKDKKTDFYESISVQSELEHEEEKGITKVCPKCGLL